MRLLLPPHATRAITRTEVLVMVVMAIFGFALLMTFMARWQTDDTGCANQLRQVGLAFRVFANDNDDKFPYLVPTNSVGGTNPAYSNETDAWQHFQAMKDELGSAEVLACPEDSLRRTNRADNFNTGIVANATSLVRRTNSAVSYSVGLDANETLPMSVLSGDRAMPRGWSPSRSAIVLLTNLPAWTTSHRADSGYYLQADCTVLPITGVPSAGKSTMLPPSSLPPGFTNRLLMPFPPP